MEQITKIDPVKQIYPFEIWSGLNYEINFMMFNQHQWTSWSGLFQKNPNRWVEDMEFLGVLKKKHVERPGNN